MNSDQTFGGWLRQRRRTLDLTQEELARQVGCSAITLRKLEAESRRPSKQIAERLAEVLKVPPNDRPAFLRFARGDPFAAPSEPNASDETSKPIARRHNLPAQLTPLIGREQIVAAIVERLRPTGPSRVRLLTLTGAGGTGKTRLALQVATELLLEFADGVFFVDLAPIPDVALVPLTITQTLGVSVLGAQVPLDRLQEHLRNRQSLLVLDNFEHVLQAGPPLAALLAGAPRLTLLVTSRVVLHLSGEQEFPVPPLLVPNLAQPPDVSALTQVAAVALFIQRAQAAQPDFQLTAASAPAVAEICVRLDGLPLAIELAAARSKILPPQALLARLSHRLSLLTGGPRDLPARQQTLRNTIDWSYGLLTAKQQILFARLGVYVGGWTLEAAAHVCNAAGDLPFDMLDGLQNLLDHCLIRKQMGSEGAPRFSMLETIGEYAQERLEASGEAEAVRRQHAAYFLTVAQTGTDLHRPQPAWLHHVETEVDNLRGAFAWSQSAVGGAEIGLRLAVTMFFFWFGHGYWSEGRIWLEAALTHADEEPVQDRHLWARALNTLPHVLGRQGAYAAAQAYSTRSLQLFQALGDRLWSGFALDELGWLAREQGDADTAHLRMDEALAIYRELGDTRCIAWNTVTQGEVAVIREDPAGATALIEEGLALFRAIELPEGVAWAYNHLGHVAQIQGQYLRAKRLHQESLPLFGETAKQNEGDLGAAWAYHGLGETALAQGESTNASAHLIKALALFRELGDRAGVSWCLAGLAGVAMLDEEPQRAAQLWGAAEAQRQAIGCRPAPAARATRERLIAAAREQLGDELFAAAWAEGEKLTMEQAVALALADE